MNSCFTASFVPIAILHVRDRIRFDVKMNSRSFSHRSQLFKCYLQLYFCAIVAQTIYTLYSHLKSLHRTVSKGDKIQIMFSFKGGFANSQQMYNFGAITTVTPIWLSAVFLQNRRLGPTTALRAEPLVLTNAVDIGTGASSIDGFRTSKI